LIQGETQFTAGRNRDPITHHIGRGEKGEKKHFYRPKQAKMVPPSSRRDKKGGEESIVLPFKGGKGKEKGEEGGDLFHGRFSRGEKENR